MHLGHLRMVPQEGGDDAGILGRALHPDLQCLERTQRHPAGMRIELHAEHAAQLQDRLDMGLRAHHGSTHEIRVAADVFGHGIEHEITAERERVLPDGAEEGVVHRDERPPARLIRKIMGPRDEMRKIDQAVRRIGRGFRKQHPHRPQGARLLDRRIDSRLSLASVKADRLDPELWQEGEQHLLGPAIKRLGMDDDVAWAHIGEQRGRDGRHAGREDDGFFAVFPQCEAIFQNLDIGIVESRIDETRFLARPRFAPAGNEIEEVLAVLGALEHEGGGEKDGGFQRSFGQLRIIAVAHHQRLGLEFMAVDAPLAIFLLFLFAHGCHPLLRILPCLS